MFTTSRSVGVCRSVRGAYRVHCCLHKLLDRRGLCAGVHAPVGQQALEHPVLHISDDCKLAVENRARLDARCVHFSAFHARTQSFIGQQVSREPLTCLPGCTNTLTSARASQHGNTTDRVAAHSTACPVLSRDGSALNARQTSTLTRMHAKKATNKNTI